MFKADGTPIKNVDKVLEAIKRTGYQQPLYTATGQDIRNPLKFAKKPANVGSAHKHGQKKRSGGKFLQKVWGGKGGGKGAQKKFGRKPGQKAVGGKPAPKMLSRKPFGKKVRNRKLKKA